MPRTIANFGGNLRFTPRHVFAPRTEAGVLAILTRHARGRVRVIGSLHSWSPAVCSEDAVVDLRHFNSVRIERNAAGEAVVRVGGGCRIRDLLRLLHTTSRFTLPSIGLITKQTVAGAISTGTHGSGKHSLSHYAEEVRLAAFTGPNGEAAIATVKGGDDLRAARCTLGCMGIILSVSLRCIPRYDVVETVAAHDSLEEVLAGERDFPLQQFYLLPHRWTYLVQRRHVAPKLSPSRGVMAILYRIWWLLGIDVGLHLLFRFLASRSRRPRWTRAFYRHVLSRLIIKNWTVADRAERMLVMKHDLFRHMELEVFVPARHLREAVRFIRYVVQWFDGADIPDEAAFDERLKRIGMNASLPTNRGRFTHHYPITFRRVLPDDTLLSMASSEREPYYAVSFITFAEPRDGFLAMAEFLTRSMVRLFAARVHWGKVCSLTPAEIESVYPRLHEFRKVCARFDPHRVFQNAFTERIVPPPSPEGEPAP